MTIARHLFIFCCLLLLSFSAIAANQPPKIAIIIDDLGNWYGQGERVVHLPGPVACSILPYTPFSVLFANQAHALGKEIILHTPMQAIEPHDLGFGGLSLDESKAKFVQTLTNDLQALPYISGINNHMGSRLTESSRAMDWVMQTIKPRGLFFIDSRTIGDSVAEDEAEKDGIPTAGRDVFLDDVRTPEAVRERFNELLSIAKHYGSAIAIGHPYAVTLNLLEEELPELAKEGYQIVPVSQLLIRPSIVSISKNIFVPHSRVIQTEHPRVYHAYLLSIYNCCSRLHQAVTHEWQEFSSVIKLHVQELNKLGSLFSQSSSNALRHLFLKREEIHFSINWKRFFSWIPSPSQIAAYLQQTWKLFPQNLQWYDQKASSFWPMYHTDFSANLSYIQIARTQHNIIWETLTNKQTYIPADTTRIAALGLKLIWLTDNQDIETQFIKSLP
jgi:polysaccharide deacetylase 2 family uncharacterized protein YibQ